jgi:hypothetical protein
MELACDTLLAQPGSWKPTASHLQAEVGIVFERMSNGWALAGSSWRVLKTDKQLLIFPLISGLALLVVMASFLAPIVVIAVNGGFENIDQDGPPVWVYPLTFAFYFCNYFVIVFCNAALTSCALMRLGGEEPRVSDGFRMAFARLPQIAGWALLSATVGLLLKMLENAHEKIGAIVSGLLGTAWSIMTFFVVPILVVEKVGPFQAVSRSVAILKKTWGESLVGNFGIGLLMFLLTIPGFLMIAGAVAVFVNAPQLFPLGITLIAAAVLYFIVLSLVGSALNSIFLAALYQYAAHDQVPAGFDRTAFEGAFRGDKVQRIPAERVPDERIL